MRMSDVFRGGSMYDPGAGDVGDGGPNRVQEGRNAAREARIAALRANPLFKKSSTPITFPQGYDPQIMQMMIGLSGQNASLANNPNLPAMFRTTRG